MSALTIDEVSAALSAAKEGPITLERSDDCFPEFGYDGWKFCVFDDCGSFDYLEWVESPDGRRWESYQDDEPQETSDGQHIHNIDETHALYASWAQESERHWLK